MIDGIILWSLRNRLLVLVGGAVLLVWGTYVASTMPIDVFPDLTAPTVTVIAEAHGMAPEEVESQITFPIEAALNGASGVRRVRSSTGVGIAENGRASCRERVEISVGGGRDMKKDEQES